MRTVSSPGSLSGEAPCWPAALLLADLAGRLEQIAEEIVVALLREGRAGGRERTEAGERDGEKHGAGARRGGQSWRQRGAST